MKLDCVSVLAFSLHIAFFSLAFIQDDQDASAMQARAVLEAATQSLGGARFLDVKTVKEEGTYTRFDENAELSLMVEFVDYIVYPDKERTEFGKGKGRFIQTNVGSTGWIYDGQQKVIRDQTPEQVSNFQRGLRRNLDGVLRRWQQSDVRLRYLGEKEVWVRQRGRGVELRFALEDGSEEVIELYVDPQTEKPLKLSYGDEEDRFYLFREFSGVWIPLRIDHYKDGLQVARIALGSVQFNQPINPRLFEKPVNLRKLK